MPSIVHRLSLLSVALASLLAVGCDAQSSAPRVSEPPSAAVRSSPPSAPTRGLDSALLARAYRTADTLPRLRSLLVARHGELLGEEYFHGASADQAANLKSASKSVISALVGIAIAEGHLEGTDQPIAPFFRESLGPDADPEKRRITVGNLLSMQAGLESTSFANYGAWVSSGNWVRDALRRPLVDEPGGRMIYSTGSTHLLSAILTRVTGQSTWAYARDKLAEPLGVRLPRWPTDPQGVYFGGNDMRMTPRAMLRFGELYRNGGQYEGRQVVPAAWVRTSWTRRTQSPFNGNGYGYGWWTRQARGHPVYFAWGYGGQFIFVVPDLALTVVTTSRAAAARSGDHLQAIYELLEDELVPAAERGATS